VRSLNDSVIQNRRSADQRHSENKVRLDTIEVSLASLASDRRVAMVVISMVTGVVMWVIAWLVTPILTKLGWK
jgi:hypothetical protein